MRDLAAYDAGLDETTIANHRIYHAFGAIVDETAPTVEHLFAFTGRPLDLDTGTSFPPSRGNAPSATETAFRI